MFKRVHGSHAFNLVGMLGVLVVLAVLVAVMLPGFTGASLQSREVALQSDLKILRNAIWLFQVDCGCSPESLADLATTTSPAFGINSTGSRKAIGPADWNGPYVASVPNDPISGNAFFYYTSPVNGHKVGELTSSSSATGRDGKAYSTW